jgi:hypothetical protein
MTTPRVVATEGPTLAELGPDLEARSIKPEKFILIRDDLADSWYVIHNWNSYHGCYLPIMRVKDMIVAKETKAWLNTVDLYQ